MSPAVADQPPEQTPLGHNPPCFLPFVGRLGGQDPASWVGYGQEYGLLSVFNKNNRWVLSYDVLRQQKTGLWPRGLCPGGGGGLTTVQAYNVEPVTTNTSSSSFANNGRRTPPLPPFVAALFSHFATRTVDNTVDLYAAKPESRFLPTSPAFDAPVSGPSGRGFPSEYRHSVWRGKTRIAWLPDGEKISKISLFVLTQFTNVVD